MNVSVVVPARDEQERIVRTLISLREQTLPLFEIIVLDDGSTDDTATISRRYADFVINLQHHEESYVGKPELALVLNEGLKRVSNSCDYVLIVGADHNLPKNYVEVLVSRMVKEDVKIASGYIKGEPYHPEIPRGSGRAYYYKFFKGLGFFPVNWGWESYILFKAMQMGCRVRCYKDVDAGNARPTQIDKKKLYYYGKGMKAIGYDFTYALGRIIVNKSWSMLRGYLSMNIQVYQDIAPFVKEWQKKMFWSGVKRVLLNER